MTIFQNVPFYSLIVSISLIALWGVWRITGLKRHTYWRINRLILVLIPIISLLIGIIPFSIPEKEISTLVEINPIITPVTNHTEAPPLNIKKLSFYPSGLSAVIIIYWVGFSISLLKMFIGIFQVLTIIKQSSKSTENPHLRFSPDKNIMPFSWGRWIVLPEGSSGENYSVVLTHEEAHLRLNHWLDLILINIVKAVTWYCPVTYAIARDMAENHEFEADNSVLQAGYNAPDYQIYLVEKAARRRFANSVVSGINNPYSLIKSRILMMQRKKSSRSVTLRALGFIPVAVMLCMSATSPMLAAYIQKNPAGTVSTVKVTEVAINLTDEEIMQPMTEEITLPKVTDKVYSKWAGGLFYPAYLAADGKQGRVIIKATVNSAGEITETSVFKSFGYKEFDDAAVKAIDKTTGLTAATYKGNKADIDVLIPVTFKKQTGTELPPIEINSGYLLDEIIAITQ